MRVGLQEALGQSAPPGACAGAGGGGQRRGLEVTPQDALHDDRNLVGLLVQGILGHLVLQGGGKAEPDEGEDEQAEQREAQQQAASPEPPEP